MTRDEVINLLALITAHDNRNPTEADLQVWGEHAERGRWSWGEAREAVATHFHHSSEWLMPSHVAAIVTGNRQDRHARHQLEPNPTGPPADHERVRAIVDQLATEHDWTPKVSPALSVRCPHCHAQPNYPCTRPGQRGATVATGAHPSRRDTAPRTVPDGQPGRTQPMGDGSDG